ncbi:MAG TPA: hypothetical protein VGH79_08615 [Gaiellaceae bacterium]|jgi:hypothetical protein
MTEEERPWAIETFRDEVRRLVDRIQAGDIEPAATDLWETAFAQVPSSVFAHGLWVIWGGITDHFTHPKGDAAEGCRLATLATSELQRALGEEGRERTYCDEWVERISGRGSNSP